MSSTLEEARRLCAKGVCVIPIPRGSKNPNRAGWQNERHALDALDGVFSQERNIGVLLGEPSGGLVDVDLDAQEAIKCASFFLPATGWKHGRESKPSSHWFYRCDPPDSAPRTRKFADVDGTALVELRGTGGQTVVPPSAHPSGEDVVYYATGEAAQVDVNAISEAVAHLACASLLARHWPAQGSRHEAALAIGGFLLRRGVGAGLCARIVERAAQAAGDIESRDRAQAVMDTADRLNRGESVTGGPTAAGIVGEKILSRLEAWVVPTRVGMPTSSSPGGLGVRGEGSGVGAERKTTGVGAIGFEAGVAYGGMESALQTLTPDHRNPSPIFPTPDPSPPTPNPSLSSLKRDVVFRRESGDVFEEMV